MTTDCLRDALRTEELRDVIAVEMRAGLTARQRDDFRSARRKTHALSPAPLYPPEFTRTDFIDAVVQAVAEGAGYAEGEG